MNNRTDITQFWVFSPKLRQEPSVNFRICQNTFDRNFTFFRERGRDLRMFCTHTTSLFGGRGSARCLEGSVPAKTGQSKRVNKSTPTRHLPVVPTAFDIDSMGPGTSSFFSLLILEAQVRRATEASSRRRASVFGEGRAADLEKSTSCRVLHSLPGVELWLASSQI